MLKIEKICFNFFFPKCLFPFKGEGFQRELLVGNDTYYLFSLRHLFEGVDVSLNLFNKASVRRYAKKAFLLIALLLIMKVSLSLQESLPQPLHLKK